MALMRKSYWNRINAFKLVCEDIIATQFKIKNISRGQIDIHAAH